MNPLLIAEYFAKQNWCLHEPVLRNLIAIADRHVRGERLSPQEIEAATGRKPPPKGDEAGLEMRGDTALLHVDGVVAKYSRMVNDVSQPRGTSIEQLRKDLRTALRDPECNAICLRIESPGGSADGLPDFADELFAASQQKCVIGVCDDLAASAAYWMGSQCTRLYANQSALVGSIGVFSAIADISRMAEDMGIHVHLISSGPNKGVGTPGVPISAEQLKPFQAIVNSLYGDFTAAIVRGRKDRGLTAERLAPQADGRCFMARDALAGGLIDGICTIEQCLASPRPGLRNRPILVPGYSAGTQTPQEKQAMAGETKTAEQIAAEKKAADEKTAQEATAKAEAEKKAADDKAAADAKTAAEKKAGGNPPAKDAVSVERERVAEIDRELDLPELREVRGKALSEGWTVERAKAEGFATLKTALAAEKASQSDAQKRLEAIAKGGRRLSAAPDAGEDGAGEPGADAEDAHVFDSAVEFYMSAAGKGMSRGVAIGKAARKYPKAHAAWIAATQVR